MIYNKFTSNWTPLEVAGFEFNFDNDIPSIINSIVEVSNTSVKRCHCLSNNFPLKDNLLPSTLTFFPFMIIGRSTICSFINDLILYYVNILGYSKI